MKNIPITALFVDIGGILLTNGWDRYSRKQAATDFKLDWGEMENRHQLNVAIYEEGKLALKEYLNRVVFYQNRPFTHAEFRRFMFSQSKPLPQMIELVKCLKAKYGLKVIVVSNEGRELNVYRIRKFKLYAFVDAFISSCFVHIRKPDAEIFRLALDISQAPAQQVIFIDNTLMFTQVAEDLGIKSILHMDYQTTYLKLASFGLLNIA